MWLLCLLTSVDANSKLIVVEAGGLEVLFRKLARHTSSPQVNVSVRTQINILFLMFISDGLMGMPLLAMKEKLPSLVVQLVNQSLALKPSVSSQVLLQAYSQISEVIHSLYRFRLVMQNLCILALNHSLSFT